jgi:hypothetical protein
VPPLLVASLHLPAHSSERAAIHISRGGSWDIVTACKWSARKMAVTAHCTMHGLHLRLHLVCYPCMAMAMAVANLFTNARHTPLDTEAAQGRVDLLLHRYFTKAEDHCGRVCSVRATQ